MEQFVIDKIPVLFEQRLDSRQGNYVVANSRNFEITLEKKAIVLDGLSVNVGDKTTLYGWFNSEVLFCGFYRENWAIFYLGEGENNLFNEKGHYYDATCILSPDRIGKSYRKHTFRDAWLKKDKNGKNFWH